MKYILILFSIFLLSSPLFGQSSKCTRVQIGKMVKLGLSESEILEVCEKPTIKSEDKTKQVVEEPKPVVEKPKIKPIKYSDKLGIRSNEGNLSTSNELGNLLKGNFSTKFLNPPKGTDTSLTRTSKTFVV